MPSAHLTVGRFVSQKNHDSPEKVRRWIQEIEAINDWLVEKWWPQLEWVVGEGVGLDAREGKLWYGGGQSIRVGKGF